MPSSADAPPRGVRAAKSDCNGGRVHDCLCRDVDDNLVKTGRPGKWAAIWFPFLHVALAVRRANDDRVIARFIGHPAVGRVPQRPGEIAAGVVNARFIPRFSVIKRARLMRC